MSNLDELLKEKEEPSKKDDNAQHSQEESQEISEAAVQEIRDGIQKYMVGADDDGDPVSLAILSGYVPGSGSEEDVKFNYSFLETAVKSIVFNGELATVELEFFSVHNIWLSRLMEIWEEFPERHHTEGLELSLVIMPLSYDFKYVLVCSGMAACVRGISEDTGRATQVSCIFPSIQVEVMENSVTMAEAEAEFNREYQENMIASGMDEEEMDAEENAEIVGAINQGEEREEGFGPEVKDTSGVRGLTSGFRFTDD